MESSKVQEVINKLQKMRTTLEDGDTCGPIPYIDEAIENLERAVEELEQYKDV